MKARADFAAPERAWHLREYGVAGAIALLHALLWISLQSSRGAQTPAVARITLWLLPAPETDVQHSSQTPVRAPARVLAHAPGLVGRSAIRPPAMPEVELPAVAEVAERAGVAEKADGADGAVGAEKEASVARADLLGSALRDVGKVDRGLRQEFPGFPAPRPVSIQSRLESAFSSAARHNGIAPVMEDRHLPDGTRITRVTTSSGSYCVTQKGAGANDGIDRIANGNPFQVTSCGNLFN